MMRRLTELDRSSAATPAEGTLPDAKRFGPVPAAVLREENPPIEGEVVGASSSAGT